MHVLAVFDTDLAHPPEGLVYRDKSAASPPSSAEERVCRATQELSRVLSLIEAEEEEEKGEKEGFVDVAAEKQGKRGGPARQHRRETTRLDLGAGAAAGAGAGAGGGFAAELCARSHVASRGGVHALFARAPPPAGARGEGEEDAVAPFEWPGFLAVAASAADSAAEQEEEGETEEKAAEEEASEAAEAAEAAVAGAEAASFVAEALADAAATATNPAEAALAFYKEFAARLPREAEEAARVALSKAKGGFSFVVYDANQQRLVAARDPLGLAPLAWGVKDGLLLLGSDPEDLAGCEPSAVAFGPGTFFVSGATAPASPGARGFVLRDGPAAAAAAGTGRLLSFVPSVAARPAPAAAFAAALEAERERRRRRSLERLRSRGGQEPPQAPVSSQRAAAGAAAGSSAPSWCGIRAVPRLNADGVMCGAIYRVASEGSLPSAVF